MPGAVAVCGLAVEARIARAAGFSVVVGGGDPARTRALVKSAAAEATCLVSFGIAGGLATELRAGTIILTGEVVAEGGHWVADDLLCRRLSALAAEVGAITGPVFGASAIVATRADKAHTRAHTGALAADLESAIVACRAAAAGIPFIVLRVIADAAGCDLPPVARLPLAADGKPAIGRVVIELLRRPNQIAGVIRLARATRTALSALIGPASALHRLLGGA